MAQTLLLPIHGPVGTKPESPVLRRLSSAVAQKYRSIVLLRYRLAPLLGHTQTGDSIRFAPPLRGLGAFAESPHHPFKRVILLFGQFLFKAFEFLFANPVGTITIPFGHMKSVYHYPSVRQLRSHRIDVPVMHIGTDRFNRPFQTMGNLGQECLHRCLFAID